LLLGLSGIGGTLFLLGILGLAAALVFHLITLPTEFDASARALAILEGNGYLTREENQGARSVLNAAALTYVAAAIGALATLLYYLGFLRRDE
jgi:Zn-dependent membrane protease YugP